MEIRGHRECRTCGHRWSYYETGSVTCPACGSVQSVGLDDERVLHTASASTLDLAPVRARHGEAPPADVLDEAASRSRAYAREQGFVRAGDLLTLDDTYLAARELAALADHLDRSQPPADAAEHYLLTLLRGADEGERPTPDAVPEDLRPARGLAVATAVRDYLRDLRAWRDRASGTGEPAVGDDDARGDDGEPAVDDVVERLDDHVRRVRALQGDVDPADAERLVSAARALATGLRDDDQTAVEDAAAHLAALA